MMSSLKGDITTRSWLMPPVNLSEAGFGFLVDAALNAQDQGDMETARALDKIARKLNAALTTEKYRGMRSFSPSTSAHTWRDVPSCLATVREARSR
jgi:hypothetical protein